MRVKIPSWKLAIESTQPSDNLPENFGIHKQPLRQHYGSIFEIEI